MYSVAITLLILLTLFDIVSCFTLVPFAPRATRRFALATCSAQQQQQHVDETCDVLVLGSGPAGRAIASLLGNDLKVVLADQNLDREWPPNYGVWRDEWDAILDRYATFNISLSGGKNGECIDREWNVTDCYFGGSFDIPTTERLRVDRPYCRVDRFALRAALSQGNYQEVRANHISKVQNINLYEPAGSLVHDAEGSTVTLQDKSGSETSCTNQTRGGHDGT